MINSFEDFETHVINMIKIRSKNFVNTDCDMDVLINLVYTDIMTKIILDWTKDEYLCDGSETITIKENNFDSTIIDFVVTEKYGLPTDIVDEYDYHIDKVLERVNTYEYKFVTEDLADEFNGKNIYFIRPIEYDITTLPSRYYDEILNALIEGIMYHIEVSIPSQVDGQISNMFYQRYFSEKQKLVDKYPQVQYVDSNFPKRTIYGRYSL